MAAAGAVVAIVGTAMKVAGDIESANAQDKAAQATARGYDHDAEVADTNASQTRAQTAENAMKLGIMARRHIGSMSAAYGAANVTRSGSVVDVLAEASSQYQSDVHDMKRQGEIKALGFDEQAGFDRKKAEYYRYAGSDAASALGFRAGADVASAYPAISDAMPVSSGSSGKGGYA